MLAAVALPVPVAALTTPLHPLFARPSGFLTLLPDGPPPLCLALLLRRLSLLDGAALLDRAALLRCAWAAIYPLASLVALDPGTAPVALRPSAAPVAVFPPSAAIAIFAAVAMTSPVAPVALAAPLPLVAIAPLVAMHVIASPLIAVPVPVIAVVAMARAAPQPIATLVIGPPVAIAPAIPDIIPRAGIVIIVIPAVIRFVITGPVAYRDPTTVIAIVNDTGAEPKRRRCQDCGAQEEGRHLFSPSDLLSSPSYALRFEPGLNPPIHFVTFSMGLRGCSICAEGGRVP